MKNNQPQYTIQENDESEIASLRSRMTVMRESEASFEAYEALREAADIQDNRSTFF